MSVKFKIGAVFSAIGLPLLAGGVFWGVNSYQFVSKAVDVTGSVVENVRDTCTRTENKRTVSYTCYQPVVSYQYNSKTFRSALSERSSNGYAIGEAIELKLDPKNPGDVSTATGLWIGPFALSFFGFVFGGIGVLLLRSHLRRKQLEAELLRRGTETTAVVIEFGENRSVSVNGRHPLMLRAQFTHPSTQQPVIAEASELWHDPVLAGEVAEDKTVRVIYDQRDPRRCMIVLNEHKRPKAA